MSDSHGAGVPLVNTLIKADQLLNQFSEDVPELSLRQLTERTKLPRASVYRYLTTLRHLGYVQYDDRTQLYRLGYKLLEFGTRVQDQLELRSVALPYMERLRDETGDTVQLQVVDGEEGVYIEKVEAREGFRMWTHVGMRRPLHAGCSMKVMLAYMDSAKVNRVLSRTLQSYTDLTIVDPDALREQLAQIRADGYAVSYGESRAGVTGIAAPIRDATREVIASMSLLGPATRFSEERIKGLIPSVVGTARDISATLGCPRSALEP